MGLFSRKEEVPKEGNELYTDRKYNTYWLLGLSPFTDYTAEQMSDALGKEMRKLKHVLNTDPVSMVKVKTEMKLEKLQHVSDNMKLMDAERDQAILMFNEDMIRSNGGTSTDRALIDSAIARTGWKDGMSLLSVEGMPQCGSCGYINRATKKCINCGKRLRSASE